MLCYAGVGEIRQARLKMNSESTEEIMLLPSDGNGGRLRLIRGSESELQERAAAGDAEAQYALAATYYRGLYGVRKDIAKAVKYAKASAEGGFMPGQWLYAFLCERGLAGRNMQAIAVHYYTAAFNQGHGRAALRLGLMLSSGKVMPPDYDAALPWFWRASKRGVEEAEALSVAAAYMSAEKSAEDLRRTMRLFA